MATMRLQPSNFIRLYKLYWMIGSLSLAINIFKRGQTKSILYFLENGGKIGYENKRWVARFGRQLIIIDRLLGRGVHVLEFLESVEFSGWRVTVDEFDDIIVESDHRKMRFNSYENVASMQEFFIEYECLEVRGKIVIDIGAYKGESALYFWARGATKVLALEPFQLFYQQALANVHKNCLSGEIEVLNAGIGDAIHEFEMNQGGNAYGTLLCMNDLRLWLLQNKTENSDLVLKIDCEGCEYELYKDPKTISQWRALGLTEFVMEYHGGDVSTLIKNWRANGFRVYRVLKKNDEIGIIHGCLEPS